MSEDSDRFRIRARQCRELAKVARDEHSRKTLRAMAVELEAEADRIDAETSVVQMPPHAGRPPQG